MRKVFPETPPKSVKFQKKDEIPLNYAAHSAPQMIENKGHFLYVL